MQHTKPHRRRKRVSVDRLAYVNEIQTGIIGCVGLFASAEIGFYLCYLAKFVWHII